MRKRGLVLVVLLVIGLTLVPIRPAEAGSPIADIPVSFKVVNSNTSGVPCASDGRTYTVRGHLTGPSSALAGPHASLVTVYLTGWEAGEWNWRFRDVAGYDHPAELARLG